MVLGARSCPNPNLAHAKPLYNRLLQIVFVHQGSQLFENQYYSNIVLDIYTFLSPSCLKPKHKTEECEKMRKTKLLLPIILGILLPSVLLVAPSFAANTTGLTAAVTATKDQVITGTVNATGFDIGIYVGPGVTGVVIKNAKIFGANDHGIYIQDTSGIVVKDSTITGNGVAPHSGLTEDKAIALAGTTGVVIKDNNVSFNLVDGGISVIDDGPVNPAQPNPGSPHPSKGNVVMGNLVKDNVGACGIVVASKNTGERVAYNVIIDNSVIGNSPGPFPPYIGGIVVAGILATDNIILGNVIKGGWIAGIVIHSIKPGDLVEGTVIINNRLDSNGISDAPGTTGINIVAFSGVVKNTLVIGNTVTNDYYGVWHQNDINTKIFRLQGNTIVPVAP